MKSAGTKHLIEAVEQTTGFKVIVDTIEGISEDAQMISARPELPVHSIRVNKSKLHYADYIVAVQCAMLIRLWSDPKRIPVFSPSPEKVRYLADRLANSKPLTQFSGTLASQTSLQLVQGLLNQLRSMPIEILTVRDCRTECPDLHGMQADSVDAQLRVLSENLSPKIRSFAPDQIWKNNVSMSSAYTLNWSALSGTTLPMLPYQSAGFADIAEKLLAAVNTMSEKSSRAYTQIVDTWAQQLGLSALYKWETRNAHQ